MFALQYSSCRICCVAQLVSDLYDKTGVEIGLDDDGNWKVLNVDADKGSETARGDLIDAIEHDATIEIIGNAGGGTYVENGADGEPTNSLFYDGTQTEYFMDNLVGTEDKSTVGHGLTFLHEVQHTRVGGGIGDKALFSFLRPYYAKGPTVSRINKMRRELGLPERESYSPMSAGTGRYDYIPFSKEAKKAIKKRKTPTSSQPHVKISKLRSFR